MSRVRLYIATSVDGFIADRDGSVDWLAPFDARQYGYGNFISQVGALIMGRRTFDAIDAFGDGWPYAGMHVFVLSSSSPGDVPNGVAIVPRGLEAALERARHAVLNTSHKDIWIVGGAVTAQSALEAGVVDLIEVFLVPVLLGAGLNLLNDLRAHQTLTLEGAETYPDGVVRLQYSVQR
ncbi:dihydrofolate reductase family protein [Hyphomicrobium sp. D-2]|uniref:dihydrofolate reductase family protein n=1 Tax=Hyphomicrobium sp. D-2 TaxID=3041621 RepID=UPI0024554D3E|nr:dihydrofolate reductase family protein [Hyphomicrobium sp. D-2]MDH4983793.1 dihydrofolate reductase family protein [Hyphomicrobium sp. D-2]